MLDIVVKVSNVIHGPYDFKNDQVKFYIFLCGEFAKFGINQLCFGLQINYKRTVMF